MKPYLRRITGYLTAIAIGLFPVISPVGPLSDSAFAATAGSGSCQQTVNSSTGVTATQSGAYCIITFTSSNTWTVPSGVSNVDYLVVAGGGGGGGGQDNEHGGGGGGAGGFREGQTTASGALSVVVGAGGAGGAAGTGGGYNSAGSRGSNSSLGAISSTGGGGGGAYQAGPTSGGSGGGAGVAVSGLQSGASGTSGQGYSGGSVGIAGTTAHGAAGGGGAGAVGSSVPSPYSNGGNGGSGKQSSITGLYYAGGGAGGGDSGGSATSGGGAGGTTGSLLGKNGTANTGGGGGGGHAVGFGTARAGGSGGSGIVVVRYSLTPAVPTSVATQADYESVALSFSAPTQTGGLSIADYEYSLDNGATWTSLGTASAGTVTVSGLTSGTTYSIMVRAKNSAGYYSSASSASSFTTNAFAGSGDCRQKVTSTTGVISSKVGTDCVIQFTATGSNTWAVPTGLSKIDVFVVGGGGGGGGTGSRANFSGGGGAGGEVKTQNNVSVSTSTLSISVGAGGSGGSGSNTATVPTAGDSSSISGITASGGGRGGHAVATDYTTSDASAPTNGGGGGAQFGAYSGAYRTGSSSIKGGDGQSHSSTPAYQSAGGGAGASASGTAGTTSTAGSGGAGVSNTWTTSTLLFGGGGGGGKNTSGTAGSGTYGGGNGGMNSSGASGASNTGGGGGGGGAYPNGGSSGGNGGSGIVIVKYSLVPDTPVVTSTSGGDGAITVSYSLSSHTGGTSITDVEYSINNGTSWNSFGEFDGSSTISSLTNSTSYPVQIRAVNALGLVSSATTAVSVTTSTFGEILRLDGTKSSSYGGTGSTFTDLSGQSNNATIQGATWNSRSKSFNFSGTSQYLSLPTMSYSFAQGFAIHATFDFGATAQDWERIVDLGTTDDSQYIAFLRAGTGTQLTLQIKGAAGNIWTCNSVDGAIQSGLHTYSAVVSSAGNCLFLVDGTSFTTSTNGVTLELPTAALNSSVIGRSNLGNADTEGSLQSLIIYNTAQATPTCLPTESTYTGNGENGDSGIPYKVLQFTTAGSCDWTAPSGVTQADYLVVGAGGGGGGHIAGGGGGGQTVSGTKSDISSSSAYTMSVGVGGSGGQRVHSNVNGNGGSGLTSTAFTGAISASGGSGGTTLNSSTNVSGSGGSSGSGNSGAVGNYYGVTGCTTGLGGGGGGDAAAGMSANTSVQSGGAGGAGTSYSITSVSVTYGGGGGGGLNAGGTNSGCQSAGAGGAGGAGGGGAGGANVFNDLTNAATAGQAGQANLGGGGGGSSGNGTNSSTQISGGAGGSGVIIIRYTLTASAPSISTVTAGNTSLDVVFTAPTHTAGSAVTDYEYSTDGSSWSSFATATAGTLTVSSLTNGTAYTIRVRAITAVGNGVIATFGSAVTPRGTQTVSWNPTNNSLELQTATVMLNDHATALGGAVIQYGIQSGGTAGCSIADPSSPNVAFTAVGSCVVRATALQSSAYVTNYADVTLTVTKNSQSITFVSMTTKTYGDGTFTALASADSSLAVTISSNDTSVCTVSSSIVTIVSVGTCSLTATQSGDASWEAASSVTKTFTVSPKAVTVNASFLGKTYDGTSTATLTGTPTITGLLAADTNYVAVDPAKVTGSFATPTAGNSKAITVTFASGALKAGTSGDRSARYTIAGDNSPTANIAKANQATLAFTSGSSMTYGQQIALVATGGSGSGSVSYSQVSGPCSVSGTTATSTGAGSCVVTATRAGDTNYNSVTSSNFTISIAKASQSINFTSTVPTQAVSGTRYTPSASSSSGLNVSFSVTTGNGTVCSISSGTVTFASSGTCVVTAAQAGDSNYTSATAVTQTIVAGLINQNITFPAISAKEFGDAAFAAGATVSSGRSVTYATSTTSICAVNASTGLISLLAVGDCTVTASSAGDSSYAAASDVSRTFTIAPALAGKPSVTSVSFGDSQVTVAFTAPGFDGGDSIDGYQVIARGGSATLTNPSCATTSPCTITGLTNGTSYTLTVAAINAAGIGPESDASPSVTPATIPDAVTGLATTPGDRTLTVAWTPLTNAQLGGASFTQYDVSIRVRGNPWNPAVQVTGSNQLGTQSTAGYTFTGLTNGVAYDVQVVALTSVNGSALASNTSTALGVPATAPDTVAGLTVIALSYTTAVASWSAPVDDGGSSITSYSVSPACTFDQVTDTFCTLSGLTAGATVTVQVSANNLMGSGVSASRSVTMPSVPVTPSPSTAPSPTSSTSSSTTPAANNASRPGVQVISGPTPRGLVNAPVATPSSRSVPAQSAALVGGVSVPTSTTARGATSITVTAGAVSVGLGSAASGSTPATSVRNNPATGTAEIVVTTGAALPVTAGGLQPASTVQIWLPGAQGREVARATVNSDGTLASEVSLTASQSQAPIPIGRQVLQVTGFNSDGEQVVMDLVVNVAQAAPAPELYRDSNTLPELTLGQTTVTSAGQVQSVTVTVKPEVNTISFESSDWSFQVTVPSQSGTFSTLTDTSADIRLLPSGTVSLAGSGFQSETRVDVFLFSTPTLLGSFTVESDGSLAADVILDPRFATVGSHTLQLQGVGQDGYIKAVNVGVSVESPDSTGVFWPIVIWSAVSLLVIALFIVFIRLLRGRSRA